MDENHEIVSSSGRTAGSTVFILHVALRLHEPSNKSVVGHYDNVHQPGCTPPIVKNYKAANIRPSLLYRSRSDQLLQLPCIHPWLSRHDTTRKWKWMSAHAIDNDQEQDTNHSH